MPNDKPDLHAEVQAIKQTLADLTARVDRLFVAIEEKAKPTAEAVPARGTHGPARGLLARAMMHVADTVEENDPEDAASLRAAAAKIAADAAKKSPS
jgi:hypothetical protein